MHHAFFVHFFAVVARSRRETERFKGDVTRDIATLCSTTNRCCELSLVTSPYGDVTRNGRQGRFSAKYSVAMLEQRCNHSKQCRNNALMLCCAKNRCCESSRVTSPLESC